MGLTVAPHDCLLQPGLGGELEPHVPPICHVLWGVGGGCKLTKFPHDSLSISLPVKPPGPQAHPPLQVTGNVDQAGKQSKFQY